jgi:flagellar motor switch protein FliM
MSSYSQILETSDTVDQSEVEQLLAQVASEAAQSAQQQNQKRKETVAPYEVRNASLLSQQQLRKLRQHQEIFAMDLGARLSTLLRAEMVLKVGAVETISYQRMEGDWPAAVNLTVFKAEPLRGHGILEIPTGLALAMVERLLGGAAAGPQAARNLSEIESGLLEQIEQMILNNWCGHWSRMRELKPVILGHETNPAFVPTTPPQTNVLAVTLELEMGGIQDEIQIGIPYALMEPLVRQLAQTGEAVEAAPAPTQKTGSKWNPAFDDMTVRISVAWPRLEVSAGEVLQLKAGDILRLDGNSAQDVVVRIADLPKFSARIGTLGGRWAAQLTQIIRP